MAIELWAEVCECREGFCANLVEPPDQCICKLKGEVKTMNCLVCDPGGEGATWHQNGECLRCRYLKQKKI